MQKFLDSFDEFVGDVAKFIQTNPTAALFLFILVAFIISMPRAHAALEITVCGSASYECPTPVTNGPPLGTGGVTVTGVGDKIGSAKVIDPVTGQVTHVITNAGAVYRKIPPGWTVGPNGEAVPPPTDGPPIVTYETTGGIKAGSAAAVCQQFAADEVYVRSTETLCTFRLKVDNPETERYAPITKASECKPGYGITDDPNVCKLTNPDAVKKPSDGACQVARVNNVYTNDPQDPDCDATNASSAASQTGVGGTGTNTVTVGTQGNGIVITANPDGSTTISTAQPSNGGTTMRGRIDVGPAAAADGSGPVTGVAYTNTPGQGTQSAADAGPDGNCGAPGQSECSVRVNEAGSADTANAVSKATQALGELAQLGSAAQGAQSSGDMSAFGVGKYQAQTDDASKLLVPLQGSDTCEPYPATMFGKTFFVDYCPLANYMKPIFAWLFSAFVAIYAWQAFQPSTRAA